MTQFDESDARFARAFELVIGHEGGFQNDPKDRGNWTGGKRGVGERRGTKFGISAMAYPDLDIMSLTLDDARRIYERDYWLAAGCDLLPAGVAYITFDCSVNQGVGRAIRWMQMAVGTGADGKIGPATRRAIREAEGRAGDVIKEIAAQRIFHYMKLHSLNGHFGLGWARRGIDVALTADAFAAEEARHGLKDAIVGTVKRTDDPLGFPEGWTPHESGGPQVNWEAWREPGRDR